MYQWNFLKLSSRVWYVSSERMPFVAIASVESTNTYLPCEALLISLQTPCHKYHMTQFEIGRNRISGCENAENDNHLVR
jgi:hypothetical protein